MLKDVVIPAAHSGKVKTTLQGLALGLLCLPLRQVDGALDAVGEVVFYLAQVLLAGAVAMTLWSGYEFFRDVLRQRRAPRQLITKCCHVTFGSSLASLAVSGEGRVSRAHIIRHPWFPGTRTSEGSFDALTSQDHRCSSGGLALVSSGAGPRGPAPAVANPAAPASSSARCTAVAATPAPR